MGKTGLILHAFQRLNQLYPQRKTIYIDLFPTENLTDFARTFSLGVLGQLDSNPMRILKKATALLKGLRLNMTVDEITGQPKLGVDVTQGNETTTIEQVFDYLKRNEKECYIALDEFQQIATYPEKNVEALLRSHIQNLHHVHFIFSGSRVHMLNEMFLSPKRPFYQSSTNKTIGPIDETSYFSFAEHFFAWQGRKLPEETFRFLYDRYQGHTWYVQKVLNKLYEKQNLLLNDEAVTEAIADILKDNEYYYQTLLRAYSKGQGKLLKAIANERIAKGITSGAFITKYGLTATSSVKSALSRLVDDEIIYPSEDGYMIYDRFFGDWLAQTYRFQ